MPPPQIGLVGQGDWLVQVSRVVVVVVVEVAVHDLHGTTTGTVVVLIWIVVEVKNSLVVAVIISTEGVYRVVIWVMVMVVCAGHVWEVEGEEVGVGVHAGRVGVYQGDEVLEGAVHTPQVPPLFTSEPLQPSLPPPSFPRSSFFAPATIRAKRVTQRKSFIFQTAALV